MALQHLRHGGVFRAESDPALEIHAHSGIGITQTRDDGCRHGGRGTLFAGNYWPSQFLRLRNNVCKSHRNLAAKKLKKNERLPIAFDVSSKQTLRKLDSLWHISRYSIRLIYGVRKAG